MTALIVDDERLARLELRRLLAAHPEITTIHEAADAPLARSIVAAKQPDVVFLDIQMPGETGFDLIARLPADGCKIIFTTAHQEHAIRAFEVNALDYLLKPIAPERLASALQRMTAPETAVKETAPSETAPKLRADDKVFLRADERTWFIPVSSIQLLESEGNHTRVCFGREHPLIHRSLSALEARLPEEMFVRANRSQIINLTTIASITPWFSGCLKMTLTTGEKVEFSRRQTQIFRERQSL